MYELVEHDPPYSTLYICLISKLLSRINRVVQIVHFYLFLTLLDIVDIGSMDQDDDVCTAENYHPRSHSGTAG